MALLIFLWLRFTFTILFLRLRSFAISHGHSILKKLFQTFVKFYKVKISSIFLFLFNILKRLPFARNSKTLLTVSQKLALSPLKWAIDEQRMILPLISARENDVFCYVTKDSESFESDSEEDSDEDNPQESADGCSETPSVVEENSGKEESPKCPRGVTSRKGFPLQSPSHSAGAASLLSPSQQATQFPEKSPSAAQATERNDWTKLAPVETRTINIGSRRNQTKQRAASNVQETFMKRNKQPDLGISEVKSFKKGDLPEFILEVESSSKKTMKEGDAVFLRTPSHQSTGVPFQSPSHQAMGVPFQSPSRPAAPFSVQSAESPAAPVSVQTAGHPAAPVSVQSPSRRAAPVSVQSPSLPIAALFAQSRSQRLMDSVYRSFRLQQPFHKRDTPKMMRSIEADKGEQSAGPHLESPCKRRIGPCASFSGKKQRFEQESESDRANTELKEADDHSLCRYETLGPSRSSPEKLPSVAKATERMSRTKSVTAETRTINIGSSSCQTEQQAASNVQETFIRRNRQPDQSVSEVKSFKKSDLPKFILEVESLSKTMKEGDAASVLHPNVGSDTPPEQEKSDESNFHKRDTPKMMRSIEADKGKQSAAGGSNASADASSVRLGKRAENARTPGITSDNIEQPAHKIHKRVKESHKPVSQQASNLVRSEENVFIESSAQTSGAFRSDSASLRPDPETHIDILEGLASRLIDQHRYESEEDSAKGLSSRMANKDESISTNPKKNQDGTRKTTISEAASEEVRNISSKRPSVIITVETPSLSEAASKEVHNISSIRPSVIIPVEALDCVGVSGQSSSSVSTRHKGSFSPRERPQRLRPDPGSTLRKEEKDMQFALLESWNEEKSRAETPGQEKSGISEKKGRVALEGEHGSKGKEAEPHKEEITESAAFGAGPSYADPKKVKKDHRFQKKFYREKREQLEADNKKPKQDPFGDVDDLKLKEKGKKILKQGEIIREELHLHTDSDKNISPTDSYRNSPLKGNPSTNSPSTLTEDIPPSLRMSASLSDDRIHGAHAPPEHASKRFPESPELHSSIEKTCTGKTAPSDPKLEDSPSEEANTPSLLLGSDHGAPILAKQLGKPSLIDPTPVSSPHGYVTGDSVGTNSPQELSMRSDSQRSLVKKSSLEDFSLTSSPSGPLPLRSSLTSSAPTTLPMNENLPISGRELAPESLALDGSTLGTAPTNYNLYVLPQEPFDLNPPGGPLPLDSNLSELRGPLPADPKLSDELSDIQGQSPSLRTDISPSNDGISKPDVTPKKGPSNFRESSELPSLGKKPFTVQTTSSDPRQEDSPSVDASTSRLLRGPAHDTSVLAEILSRPPLIDSTPVSLPRKSFHGREYPPEDSGPSGELLGYQPEVSDQSDELRGCPPEVSVPSDDLSECPPEVPGPSGEPRVHPPEDPSVPSVEASTSSLLRDPAHDAPILSGILSRPSLIDSTPVSSPQKSVHGREYQPEVSDQSDELRGCPPEVSVPSGDLSEYSTEVPGPSGEPSVHPPEDPSLPGELSEPVLVDPDLSDLEAHLSQLNLYGRPPSVHLNPPAQIIRPIALRINQYNAPLYFPSTFSIPFSSPSVRLNPLPLVILPAAPWTPYEGPLILEGSLRFPNLAVWLQSLSSGVVRPYSLQEGSSRGLEHSSHVSLAGGATLTASPNELAASNPEITSLFLMPSPENQLSNNGSANELSEMPEANIRDTGTGGSDKSHKNGADDGDETKVKSGTETKHSSPGEITNEAGGSETARSSLTMKRVKNWKKEMGENYSKSLMIGSSSISTEPLSSGAELSAQNNEHRLTEENLVSNLSSILPSSHSSLSRSESTNVAELRPPSDSGASVSAPGKISPMHGEGEARELLPHSSSKLPSSHFPPLPTEEAKVTELLQTSDSGGAVPSSGSITAEDSEATESLSDYGESGGYVISNPISSSSEHENGETERAPVPGSGDIPAKPQSPNNERTSK